MSLLALQLHLDRFAGGLQRLEIKAHQDGNFLADEI
jgi:hypothetical protein